LPAAAIALVIAAWYGGGAWLRPTSRALGSAWSEAPGHLWGLWATAAGLLEHGPLVRVAPGLGFPDGFEAHLVDPVDLLLFLPGYALGGGGLSGAVLGWNLLHLGAILVGGLGCVLLARTVSEGDSGDPWAAALLTAAFCGGAFLLSHPHMGRTEYLPAVLMPAQLALTLRFVRGEGSWGAGVGAGLLLGGVGLGGSYIAIFAALTAVPFAIGLLVTAGADWKRTLGRLAAVGGIAAVVTAVMVAALLLWPPPGSSPLLSAPPRPMPEVDPGTLMTIFRLGPRPDLEPLLDQPPYPGVILLLLAGLGAALRPRKAVGWLLLGLWLLLLSLGPAIAMQRDGAPLMISLPAGWMMAIAPPLANLKAWSRLGVLLPLPFAVAAAIGALAVMRRLARPWQRATLGVALVLLVLADQGSWPRMVTDERPHFEPAAPAGLLEALDQLPDGAVIQLPLEVSVGQGIKLQAARSHLWQLQHDRPITSTPAVISDTALRWSALARLAVNRQFAEAGRAGHRNQPPLPGAQGSLDKAQLACAWADAQALKERGVSGLVLLTDEPAGPGIESLLEQVLGQPPLRAEGVAAWDISAYEAPFGEPCELPPVPAKVHMMLMADGGEPDKREGGAKPGERGPWGGAEHDGKSKPLRR